jgi:DNA replication licensing factor MCM2
MLESFLQAQKISVRKTLQRSFRKYITYGEESNQLIMHQLQNLLRVAEQYKRVRVLFFSSILSKFCGRGR